MREKSRDEIDEGKERVNASAYVLLYSIVYSYVWWGDEVVWGDSTTTHASEQPRRQEKKTHLHSNEDSWLTFPTTSLLFLGAPQVDPCSYVCDVCLSVPSVSNCLDEIKDIRGGYRHGNSTGQVLSPCPFRSRSRGHAIKSLRVSVCRK